jgi:hypothetical protein
MKDLAEVVGALIAVASLVVAAYSLTQSRKTERARFWLELRDRFSSFQDIHTALCPRGEWDGSKGFPSTPAELRRLEAYMGLFEHCSAMLKEGLIDWETFDSIYSYRIGNIARNPYVVQAKLIEHAKNWKDFIWIINRMHLQLRGTDEPFDSWPFRPLIPCEDSSPFNS